MQRFIIKVCSVYKSGFAGYVVAVFCVFAVFSAPIVRSQAVAMSKKDSLLQDIRQYGREPKMFISSILDSYKLIIFDDALHTAVEPFVFYSSLVASSEIRKKAQTIFLEVIPANMQEALDAYFSTSPENPTLLYPAFQNSYNGLGFPYQTYFDFLHAVYVANSGLPTQERWRIIAVGSSVYWQAITTPKDLEHFRTSDLAVYDYYMYQVILRELDGLKGDKKGLFLTNTRHAYKGIKRADGAFFWNVGTFFHQWHPGKTYSIRMHNVYLFVESIKPPSAQIAKTTEGMERKVYKFVKIADGAWDKAFKDNGNTPIAVPFQTTAFGKEAYIGNHQAEALPNQTMSDAYDAVVFLAPLEALHSTALTSSIYTSEFLKELERRYRILYTSEQIQDELRNHGVQSLDQLFARKFQAKPQELLPQAQAILK
jgi:hypothetical protein